MLQLSSIYRFPLKSGNGESLSQVRLDKLGVEGDRRWMLVDEASGRFLTQRADPQMSQLSALWNATGGLTLKTTDKGKGNISVTLTGCPRLGSDTVPMEWYYSPKAAA